MARVSAIAPKTTIILKLKFAVLLMAISANCYGGEVYDLSAQGQAADIRTVQVVVEVNGKLKLNPDGKDVVKLPFQVLGKIKYLERLSVDQVEGRLTPSIRSYLNAHADLRLGEKDFPVDLSESNRLIRVDSKDDQTILFCPDSQMSREELELIQIPGNSALLHCLVPQKKVALLETWKPTDAILAPLVGIDSVVKSEVVARLKSVEKNVAVLEMSGPISGAVGGVSTDIELQAKANFDLEKKLVTWLAIYLKESRSIGHAVPGYDTETRIRVSVAPTDDTETFRDEFIEQNVGNLPEMAGALSFSSEKGGFEFIYDRDWHVMADRHDVTIMRLIQRGDLVAQCNVSKLPPPDKKPLTLPQFQAEVQTSLGKNFGQIVEATEGRTTQGLRVLRVVATGTASELPIEWIYYHIDDRGQRRAALVFTLEAKLAQQFGGLDQSLVEAFRFRTLTEPTPAKEAKAEAKVKR